MKYRSTRANLNYQLDAPAAIIQGLSPEGGLFLFQLLFLSQFLT